MKLTKEIVSFKSYLEYYIPEEKDLKNHTERIIDWEDERFHTLELMRLREEYGFIIISGPKSDYGVQSSFKRRITHICKWNNIMIITWQPK